MGDSSACEYAQRSHLGVLLHGRAVFPGKLLVQAAAPPRTLLTAGLVIDDLVLLQRCLLADRPGAGLPASLGASQLQAALDAYKAAPLDFNPKKKTFADELQAMFWGVDCCGTLGLVRTAPAWYWPLVLITLRVVQLGLCARALKLEILLGSWLAVSAPTEAAVPCLLAVQGCAAWRAGHLAVLDLRASICPWIFRHRCFEHLASRNQGASSRAIAREFLRRSLQKGAWIRLLAPAAAHLREQQLLEPEAELPDDEVFSTHPVAVAAATVPVYACAWRKEYKARVRINVAELEAFLREEARLAGRAAPDLPKHLNSI